MYWTEYRYGNKNKDRRQAADYRIKGRKKGRKEKKDEKLAS